MLKNNWKIQKKSMVKTSLSALMLAVGILCFYYKTGGALRISDSSFLTGLLFSCIGLYRVTRLLGLFDLPIYGFKKMGEVLLDRSYKKSESRLGDYADYKERFIYMPSVMEPCLVGGIFIALSLLLFSY